MYLKFLFETRPVLYFQKVNVHTADHTKEYLNKENLFIIKITTNNSLKQFKISNKRIVCVNKLVYYKFCTFLVDHE